MKDPFHATFPNKTQVSLFDESKCLALKYRTERQVVDVLSLSTYSGWGGTCGVSKRVTLSIHGSTLNQVGPSLMGENLALKPCKLWHC